MFLTVELSAGQNTELESAWFRHKLFLVSLILKEVDCFLVHCRQKLQQENKFQVDVWKNFSSNDNEAFG